MKVVLMMTFLFVFTLNVKAGVSCSTQLALTWIFIPAPFSGLMTTLNFYNAATGIVNNDYTEKEWRIMKRATRKLNRRLEENQKINIEELAYFVNDGDKNRDFCHFTTNDDESSSNKLMRKREIIKEIEKKLNI